MKPYLRKLKKIRHRKDIEKIFIKHAAVNFVLSIKKILKGNFVSFLKESLKYSASTLSVFSRVIIPL